jgi:hypothetical protein
MTDILKSVATDTQVRRTILMRTPLGASAPLSRSSTPAPKGRPGASRRRMASRCKTTSSRRSLLLPMGRFGPAFLAFDNFQVYPKWNSSLVYSCFVNPDSAHRGPRREAGRASIIPPDVTGSAAIKGLPRSVRRFHAGGGVAPLDVPCRRAATDAGGALGREALDAGTVASGRPPGSSSASPARRSTAMRA